jgi:hypothetical protein
MRLHMVEGIWREWSSNIFQDCLDYIQPWWRGLDTPCAELFHPLPRSPRAATLKPPPGGSWSCGRIGPSLRASAAVSLAEKALGELGAERALGTWECSEYPRRRLMSLAESLLTLLGARIWWAPPNPSWVVQCDKPRIRNTFGCPATICSPLRHGCCAGQNVVGTNYGACCGSDAPRLKWNKYGHGWMHLVWRHMKDLLPPTSWCLIVWKNAASGLDFAWGC